MDDTSALLFEMHGTTVALMLNQPSRRNALSYKMRGVVNVPCGPINNLQQMFDDPQVQHRGIRVTSPHPLAGRMPMVASPMRFSATPITYDVSPPLLGEHTRQVLGELAGIDDAAFTKLSERGIV